MEKNITSGELVILTAPSGAGKTTIAHELLRQMPELAFSISVTTRAPRSGETDGKDYYFISTEGFQQKIEENAFVEHEKVYEGRYYGTLRSELERIWNEHKCPLRVVDVKGAVYLKELYGDNALAIFIKPPSMEVLKQRLISRGADNETELPERLQRAEKEMEYEDRFDHVVLNDDLITAVKEVRKLISSFIYTSS